jgi:hypothetical protein
LKQVDYPIVLGRNDDWSDYVAKCWVSGVQAAPGITILDRSGTFRAIYYGNQDPDPGVEWVVDNLEPLLAEPSTSGTPVPGLWTASAIFGGIRFVVNGTGTGISETGFDFGLGWECGSELVGGNIDLSAGVDDWPIKDGEFTITAEGLSGPLRTIMVRGTFDDTGTEAYGDLTAVSRSNDHCQTGWDATPLE